MKHRDNPDLLEESQSHSPPLAPAPASTANSSGYALYWWISLGILLLILLVSWLNQQQPPSITPYYIALAGPTQQSDGQSMREGVELLLDEINAKGGIHQRPVELLVFNDDNQPAQAVKNAQKLIKDTRILGIIGHYSSGVTMRVMPIYQAAGIPAITATATADSITTQSEWYFRTTFTNADQAALLANYAYKVLGYKTANIISVDSVYSKSLSNAFLQAAADIQLTVANHWHYARESSAQRQQVIAQLLDAYRTSDESHVLFIATSSAQAANILTSLRRLNNRVTVIGPDSFTSKDLHARLKKLAHERSQPGYYTENVYTTSPFLGDIANQKAQFFKQAYERTYGQAPSTTAVMYYDAALVLTSALAATSSGVPIAQQREQVKLALHNKVSIATSVEGVSGDIYFDKHGNAVKAIKIAQFKNGKMTVALEQFQPIYDLPNIPELLEEALENQVIYVNGKFMRRAQVVYSGIDFNELTELDVNQGTYTADFYLWFRFNKNFEFDDAQIEFINSWEDIVLKEPLLVKNSKLEPSLVTKVYRVKTQFKANLDFHDYPLDKQILAIRFRHQDLGRDQLIYVVDARGMGSISSHDLITDLESNQIFNISGWQPKNLFFFQNIQKTDSTLGIPEWFNLQKRIEYSQFNVNIEIERNVLNFVLKNLIPIIFLILLGYVSYYLCVKNALSVRMTLSVNMIIATSLFHLKWATNMSSIDYLVLMEYLFFAIYFLALFNILINAFLYYKDDEANVKLVEYVNLFGKIFYIGFIVAAFYVVIYIYR